MHNAPAGFPTPKLQTKLHSVILSACVSTFVYVCDKYICNRSNYSGSWFYTEISMATTAKPRVLF